MNNFLIALLYVNAFLGIFIGSLLLVLTFIWAWRKHFS